MTWVPGFNHPPCDLTEVALIVLLHGSFANIYPNRVLLACQGRFVARQHFSGGQNA